LVGTLADNSNKLITQTTKRRAARLTRNILSLNPRSMAARKPLKTDS